ncbi:MAG: tRNA 4-thiouridine(8) synthase ThiI [Deltaproteobacteria bacterium]|nr:tRNA 4-thiouridine(8) synthase ThiI [Deltaproteobacteria bacterium]MBW2050770.1 tRNA 4-thiouridine(8) synthase ThiI [Deltaproteobacteria bacterium]MBW2141364.1 tRNA 4-thiouridine(8) synthase ThiI [Deltaproteobacteria bacterium]MBW2321970.1 tRNA 4-thiouridine(8) synthase ThiI [Deltaproteobacteria bacterium]
MTIAYGIFSGGLDSLLAARILVDQDIEVRLLTFVTPFFSAKRAKISSQQIGLTTRPVEITQSHLNMLENPKHGYGRFMNPCIDCHALMFNHAGRIMEEEEGDFLFSGEVLGQRPKSQIAWAMKLVARESGYADYILRPLSSLKLPPTKMELAGLVDRDRLLGLSGRSRKPQMELAAKFKIKDYPSPAGGCLLTDPIFSNRLKEFMSRTKQLSHQDVKILKWGRHFRLPGGSKLVVGRNEKENEIISKLSKPGDFILETVNIPGPTVIMSGSDPSDLELAASITVSYGDSEPDQLYKVILTSDDGKKCLEAVRQAKEVFAHLMII